MSSRREAAGSAKPLTAINQTTADQHRFTAGSLAAAHGLNSCSIGGRNPKNEANDALSCPHSAVAVEPLKLSANPRKSADADGHASRRSADQVLSRTALIEIESECGASLLGDTVTLASSFRRTRTDGSERSIQSSPTCSSNIISTISASSAEPWVARAVCREQYADAAPAILRLRTYFGLLTQPYADLRLGYDLVARGDRQIERLHIHAGCRGRFNGTRVRTGKCKDRRKNCR